MVQVIMLKNTTDAMAKFLASGRKIKICAPSDIPAPSLRRLRDADEKRAADILSGNTAERRAETSMERVRDARMAGQTESDALDCA